MSWDRDQELMEGYDLLNPDLIYVNESGDCAWRTPDGIGCYWYDSLEDALDDLGSTEPHATIEDEVVEAFLRSR